MTFAVTGPIKAADLFSLEPDGPVAGRPDFMNLKAVSIRRGRARAEELRGSGIYGVFLRDRLFYVGIYTGAGSTPFAGSVLDRWRKHLTYQTLRSPKVSFCRSALGDIVAMPGDPAEAIAGIIGGRGADLAALDPADHPLLASGGASCTANKARFAMQNWDSFAPGAEARMLEEVSFVYGRLLPEPQVLALLEGVEGKDRYLWVKHKWLGQREGALIRDLRPACNHQTDPEAARIDITAARFTDALREAFAGDLRAAGGPDARVEIAAAVAREDAAGEAEELSECLLGEPLFRSKLSEQGELLVGDLEQSLPAAMQLGFTPRTSDMRVYLDAAGQKRRMLLVVRTRNAGQLVVHTPAHVATCRALGFAAVEDGEGRTRFPLDPATAEVPALLAVAGAALQSVFGGRE